MAKSRRDEGHHGGVAIGRATGVISSKADDDRAAPKRKTSKTAAKKKQTPRGTKKSDKKR